LHNRHDNQKNPILAYFAAKASSSTTMVTKIKIAQVRPNLATTATNNTKTK
jgi:hypothetical protein